MQVLFEATPANATPTMIAATGVSAAHRSTQNHFDQVCTSYGYCWSSSTWSSSTGGPKSSYYYDYYYTCGTGSGAAGSGYSSSSSSSGSGVNCAGKPKKKKPGGGKGGRRANLAQCLGAAAVAGTQPNNGMDYWQGYCSSKFTGGEARECYGAGPEPQAVKEGFCGARFGGKV